MEHLLCARFRAKFLPCRQAEGGQVVVGGQGPLSVQALTRAPQLCTGARLLCDVRSPRLVPTNPSLSEPDGQASSLLCGPQETEGVEMHFKHRVANTDTTCIYIAQTNTFTHKYAVH